MNEKRKYHKSIWEYTVFWILIAAMISAIGLYVIVATFGDFRTTDEKLADYDHAYEECIARDMSREFCIQFAIEQSNLGR